MSQKQNGSQTPRCQCHDDANVPIETIASTEPEPVSGTIQDHELESIMREVIMTGAEVDATERRSAEAEEAEKRAASRASDAYSRMYKLVNDRYPRTTIAYRGHVYTAPRADDCAGIPRLITLADSDAKPTAADSQSQPDLSGVTVSRSSKLREAIAAAKEASRANEAAELAAKEAEERDNAAFGTFSDEVTRYPGSVVIIDGRAYANGEIFDDWDFDGVPVVIVP
jgi:hypothetical protein